MDLKITEFPKKPTDWDDSKSNQVDIERNEANPTKPSRSTAIKRKWNTFVEYSTLHGLQHVFTSKTPLRRIIWAIFLLSGIGWFSTQSFILFTKYFSYPVSTKVTLVYEDAPEFPAITICNFNMFRTSAVKQSGHEETYKYLMRKLGGLDTSNDTIESSKIESWNLTEFYLATGHQINDTVKECIWNAEECSYKNFTAILTHMGLCHTFNSGKDGQQILKVKQEGTDFGLRLMLDVQHFDYGVTGYRAGFQVLIHHHDTPPLVAQLGFAVSPGTSTYVAIQKERIVSLPAPYESNCLEKNDTNIPGYTKYTTLGCMETCQAKYVIQKCGCRSIGMPNVGNGSLCNPLVLIDCTPKEKANFQKLKGDQCNCPVPCEIISFKPVLSYAAFATEVYLARVNELTMGANNLSDETLKKHQEYISQNILELTIYFQELNYHIIEQKPAYELESLLAEIGGQVGLCVGASLLTVLEFCDVILAIIGLRLRFR